MSRRISKRSRSQSLPRRSRRLRHLPPETTLGETLCENVIPVPKDLLRHYIPENIRDSVLSPGHGLKIWSRPDLQETIDKYSVTLHENSGVHGVGFGKREDGQYYISIHVKDKDDGTRLPQELDGIPVQVFITGGVSLA